MDVIVRALVLFSYVYFKLSYFLILWDSDSDGWSWNPNDLEGPKLKGGWTSDFSSYHVLLN